MENGWWILLLAVYLTTDLPDRLNEQEREFEANKQFEDRARSCRYLELYNDGRATHHICHHPTRDDLSDWIMCGKSCCPIKENLYGISCDDTGAFARHLAGDSRE